ncbi:MAG TPA: cohesin domain-containing protein [Bryobacteraceae bacterium]|nr:cohesin domain-containing protein [Bryobacteraceae bacterium]
MNFRFLTRIVPVPVRSGWLFRGAPIAAVVLFGFSFLAAQAQDTTTSQHLPSARKAYKLGQRAEARQDYDAAFLNYQQAYKQNPADLRYRTAYDRVRVTDAAMHVTKGRALLKTGNTKGALVEFLHATEIDPSDEAAEQEIAQMRERETGAPPPQSGLSSSQSEQQKIASLGTPPTLSPISNEPLTLHMTEDAKVIYQAVGKAAGINVLFDPDYHSNRIQVDLNNVSLTDALRILETVSNTFWRPVTSNTIFVAQNTRIKHTELDEQAVQTFYLSNAWQQNDMNDVQTALRSVIRGAQFYGVASQNAIVAKGTPDELLLAQKIVDDLDKARPEVVVDIGVLEVSKNWERNLGIAWPSSVGVGLQPPNASSNSTNNNNNNNNGTGTTPASNNNTTGLTLYNLAHLNSTNFAVSVGSATLNLLLNNSQTQILQSPSIRATDGQKAQMKIGSRIPIATGSYQTGAATALVSSLVNTQFTYIDVGTQITVTPTVHYNDDVTLNMEIQVTSQSGNVTISGVTEPIISQRIVNQVIRLREGQASILGGIRDNQSQNNWTGIPGLSTIPILKYLFGSHDRIQNDDDIVFVVVPHVVRSEMLTQANLRPIDTGAGQSIDLRVHQSATPAAAQPASFVEPNLGTVPGSAAAGAAPAALEQLNSMDQNAANPQPPAPPLEAAPPQPNAAPQQQSPPAQTPAPQPAPAAPQLAPPGGAAPAAAAQPSPPATGGMAFDLSAPPDPVAAGSSFQVPVRLQGGTNVASVPMQLHYDPARLSLVNVAEGDFLSHDGQAVALVHRDDGAGNVTIVASRPPGAAGLSGSGVVCVITFQAKSAGTSVLAITRAGVVNTAQQQVNAGVSQVGVTVK